MTTLSLSLTCLCMYSTKLGGIFVFARCDSYCKKESVGPTNGLLINNLSGVLNQHMPILGIVMITM